MVPRLTTAMDCAPRIGVGRREADKLASARGERGSAHLLTQEMGRPRRAYLRTSGYSFASPKWGTSSDVLPDNCPLWLMPWPALVVDCDAEASRFVLTGTALAAAHLDTRLRAPRLPPELQQIPHVPVRIGVGRDCEHRVEGRRPAAER